MWQLYTALMSRCTWRAVSVFLAVCVMVSVAAAEQQTRFVITGPTLISFFLDYTDDEILAEGGESLYDFKSYLPAAENTLRWAGVQVHAVFRVKSFQVKMGSRWRTVKPRESGVGYYFIAPGREPRLEFGVEDSETIVDFAREYFRLKTLQPMPYPRAGTIPFTQPLPEFLITAHAAGKIDMNMARDEILRLFPPPLAVEVTTGSPEIQVFVPQESSARKVSLRLFLSPDTSRIVKMDVLDRRFRTTTNPGPGSTFGELLRGALSLSLTEDSGTWVVESFASCMTFQLDVDDATAARLKTDERIEWQHVLPEATPIRAVSLFASGCRLQDTAKGFPLRM
jgi:hypothetical protein